MVVRTHCNSNPPQKLEPKPGLAYSRSTTVLPSITQTLASAVSQFFAFFLLIGNVH